MEDAISLVTALLDEDEEGLDPAIAGAVAGLVAECIMHPVETLSSRAKVHPSSAYGGLSGSFKVIHSQEGLRGFYAGISVTALIAAPSTALYFGAYELVKATGSTLVPPQYHSGVHFLAGGVAEFCSSILFVPFDVVRSRLQLGCNPNRATGGLVPDTRNYPSISAALSSIWRKEGYRGLFSGWHSSLVQDCAFSATQFVAYEKLKRAFKDKYHRSPESSETMCIGAVSGGFAAAVTNPLDVVTTRLMVQGKDMKFGRGLIGCMRATWKEGSISFWRGTIPRVCHMTPLAAIQFAVYEYAKGVLAEWRE